MTITTTNISDWLGTRMAAQLSNAQLVMALQDANDYCNGYMQAMGVSGSGAAFDAAVFAFAKASVLRQLDVMGIKATSVNMGGSLNIGSDITENVNQLLKITDERLKMAVLTGSTNKANLYVRRLRGGQGI